MVKTRPQSTPPENHLGNEPDPLFYPLDRTSVPAAAMPPAGPGLGVRVWARSLSGMQKVALLSTDADPVSWRVASDEGPYLNGFDAAPCPLSFMTVGMVATGIEAITVGLDASHQPTPDLELTIDNRYTMEGSALRGTMRGGALGLEVGVRSEDSKADDALARLAGDALKRTPLAGLVEGVHQSRFSLTLNGHAIPVSGAADARATPRLGAMPTTPLAHATEPLISRVRTVTPTEGVAGGAGTSLRAEQRRELHVRGRGRRRPDGLIEVTQELHQPLGSTFRFLAEGRRPAGAPARAPDGANYMAAGVAFCFMTQLGRYATIVNEPLDRYEVLQDTRFNWAAAPGTAGTVTPVETQVVLDTPAGADFAQRCLTMGEQTCFLHALYRTPLSIRITD